ncbi:hypothetical protein CQY20_08405 [Mycolicibacterium agri]|uniref:Uncharacterized protein n=1 Tax=Mycolicibacterium agri TaxID=36811 RepID=A0A2A7N8U9_MYCAG|nr:DUF6390 family protein [Mycolicibacterium agri]PEG40249.1 hypothetical protein CQY20_08405 [Mycolicibacterium agri]GFG55690.1 hypothetical protein MAGR_71310 [Mycolicibacterium agri]
MTTVDAGTGAAMFARYACAPNELGYCGPPQASAMLRGSRDEIKKAAAQFTGAWPYLKVMSKMTGIPDPLDLRLVDAYWLGGGIGAGIDAQEFTAELLALVAPQAGHYWTHLTDDLADEAAPNHCFHVFGVYPWSRLLGRNLGGVNDTGPVSVLDNCRISWGTVISVEGDTATVEGRKLRWQDSALSLTAPTHLTATVEIGAVAPDELVAMHWGRVCDQLSVEQVARLEESTVLQLAVTNRRLGEHRS